MKSLITPAIILLLLLPHSAFSETRREAEVRCFEEAKGAVIPHSRIKWVRGLRGCTNFKCLRRKSRRNRLTIFRSRKAPAVVTFGNYGWDKTFAVLPKRDKNRAQTALLIAQGVDLVDLDDPRDIAISLEVQGEIISEVNCLRRAGYIERSFFELAPIPK